LIRISWGLHVRVERILPTPFSVRESPSGAIVLSTEKNGEVSTSRFLMRHHSKDVKRSTLAKILKRAALGVADFLKFDP
jgi:hypothetical protein